MERGRGARRGEPREWWQGQQGVYLGFSRVEEGGGSVMLGGLGERRVLASLASKRKPDASPLVHPDPSRLHDGYDVPQSPCLLSPHSCWRAAFPHPNHLATLYATSIDVGVTLARSWVGVPHYITKVCGFKLEINNTGAMLAGQSLVARGAKGRHRGYAYPPIPYTKPHQTGTVYTRTRSGYGFGGYGCGSDFADPYRTRAEPYNYDET
jgi:hypothetical protein